MTDLFFSLPVELCRQIVGGVDEHGLTQMARVSKMLSIDAFEALYRDLDSPWALIQLLLEPAKRAATPVDEYAAPNPRDGFAMEIVDMHTMPIHHNAFERFCEIAELVRHLSCIENASQMCSECCAIASEHIHQARRIIYHRAEGDLLMRLLSLQASCTTPYGVRSFVPWLSSSLQTLDLAFGPEIDDISVISSLLHIRELCTAVMYLTFILDSSNHSQRRDGVIDALFDAILSMPKLRKVSLPSELVTRPIVDALAELPYLNTLSFTPATSPVVWDTAYTPSILFATSDGDGSDATDDTLSELDVQLDELSPIILRGLPPVSDDTFQSMSSIATSRFYALHNMRTSARSWLEVATIVRAMNPKLRRLVVSLPAQHSTMEREAALDDISAHCPGCEIHVEEV